MFHTYFIWILQIISDFRPHSCDTTSVRSCLSARRSGCVVPLGLSIHVEGIAADTGGLRGARRSHWRWRDAVGARWSGCAPSPSAETNCRRRRLGARPIPGIPRSIPWSISVRARRPGWPHRRIGARVAGVGWPRWRVGVIRHGVACRVRGRRRCGVARRKASLRRVRGASVLGHTVGRSARGCRRVISCARPVS